MKVLGRGCGEEGWGKGCGRGDMEGSGRGIWRGDRGCGCRDMEGRDRVWMCRWEKEGGRCLPCKQTEVVVFPDKLFFIEMY